MEIPHTVTARKDTGLYNAKMGIWLFLASEVMLFGGLFSGYIFLRIYADYPWPERTLPIVPGLVNTFVLISSSVTVVFAWASLKMRKWKAFQVFMGITLLCSLLFLVLKTIEYKAKWDHQAVRFQDYAIVEGHVHKARMGKDGNIHMDHGHGSHAQVQDPDGSADAGLHLIDTHGGGGQESGAGGHHAEGEHAEGHGHKGHAETYGDQFGHNVVVFQTDEITVDLVRYDEGTIEDLIAQSKEQGVEFILTQKFKGQRKHDRDEEVVGEAGASMSMDLLKEARALFVDARTHNAKIRTKALKEGWKKIDENPRNKSRLSYDLATEVEPDPRYDRFLVTVPSTMTFKAGSTVSLRFPPRHIDEGETTSTLRDGTILVGELNKDSSAIALAVDAIDFRFVAMRAREREIDPEAAIEQTWIMKDPKVQKLWKKHQAHIEEFEKELLEKHGVDEMGHPKKEPTDTERYRIGWKELVKYGAEIDFGHFDGFAGPNHKADYASVSFPEMVIPREQVGFESVFAPRWNTYYAIYFLMTGLHGLHVIGGAVVLGYFMFFGKKLYLKNPEHMANRVEVGGLFWHFVDLVWIFLFPILYLM